MLPLSGHLMAASVSPERRLAFWASTARPEANAARASACCPSCCRAEPSRMYAWNTRKQCAYEIHVQSHAFSFIVTSFLHYNKLPVPLKYTIFENIMKMESLFLKSEFFNFHNFFKSIQILTWLFFHFCLKIENDVMLGVTSKCCNAHMCVRHCILFAHWTDSRIKIVNL